MHAAQLARANVAARSGVQPGIASRLGEAHAALEGIESRGRQFAASGRPLTSSAGAIGVMQVMPGTGPEAARLAGVAWDPARLRGDADYNRRLGRAYYNEMLRQFGGDAEKAAAAYNAGPGSARRGTGVRGAIARAARAGEPDNWRAHLPQETQAYIRQFRERMGGDVRAVEGGGSPRIADDMVPEAARADGDFAVAREADLSPIHLPMPELRRDLFASTGDWRRAQREVDDDLAGVSSVAPRETVPHERDADALGAAGEVDAEASARTVEDDVPPEQMVDPATMAAWRATLARLTGDQAGEAIGALTHPDVGPIDVVWGNDKGGLAHILAKHPEVADDLPEHLARMEVVRRSDNRVRLESGTHAAGVRLDYDGDVKRWLVTAYEREAPVPADVSRAGTKGRDVSPARGAGDDIGDASPAINDAPMLSGFGDGEDGAGAAATLASLDHDARVRLDADPNAAVWIGDDAQPVRLADMLNELDAEDAAINAARRCL
ncbi:MAG: transglycosylase SLT domain-containing protein [Sphingomonas ginsenosidimutans]|nr:transglycosylase SLT domain-containing protein [Sphingomonas ginsenosidimutans]